SAVIGSLDEAIWSTSPDGKQFYLLTGGVESTFARPAQDFFDRPGLWFDLILESERAALQDAFREIIHTEHFLLNYAIRTPTGEARHLMSRGRLVRSADGEPLRVDGITRIIPENERIASEARIRELEARLAVAEAQSRETARLEVVGRLLSGAAHDFNNLLTIITGHAELVRENLMPHDPLCEPVELIAESGHTAARVARQLIAYARPAAAEATALDPNAAVRDAERMLRRFTGEGIELDLLLTPGVDPIRVDRGEFDRVVLNLVVNARDAIDETGVITVRTAMAAVAADRGGWPDNCPPGDYVALTVTDTGCGMTDDVKERAFTRFFTTKGSKGTGLGLATVRDIVHAAEGHIEVESSPEWGTSVRVFWPVATENDEPIRMSFP
ncbi:MAG TPA: ATP-binding protein, partial [Urbifossiella sp.]